MHKNSGPNYNALTRAIKILCNIIHKYTQINNIKYNQYTGIYHIIYYIYHRREVNTMGGEPGKTSENDHYLKREYRENNSHGKLYIYIDAPNLSS